MLRRYFELQVVGLGLIGVITVAVGIVTADVVTLVLGVVASATGYGLYRWLSSREF